MAGDESSQIVTCVPCNVCGRGFRARDQMYLELGKKAWQGFICDGCTRLVVRTWLVKTPRSPSGASSTTMA